MHSYEFIFKCQRCEKELTEHIVSPEALTEDELNRMEFQLACHNAKCGWGGKRTGAEAKEIRALRKPAAVCG
jgi:hypothetical protein